MQGQVGLLLQTEASLQDNGSTASGGSWGILEGVSNTVQVGGSERTLWNEKGVWQEGVKRPITRKSSPEPKSHYENGMERKRSVEKTTPKYSPANIRKKPKEPPTGPSETVHKRIKEPIPGKSGWEPQGTGYKQTRVR